MNCGENWSLLTTLSTHALNVLSIPFTLLPDISLSKEKVIGLYRELKEDTA